MNTTVPMTTIAPLERVAHHLGLALVRWSTASAERRAARHTVLAAPSRSAAQREFSEQLALEARHRSWDRLASSTPRLR